MIDWSDRDPGMSRTGARQFFYSFFRQDFLQDESSVEEAVEEYVGCEGDDPGAENLRNDIEELIASDLSDEELASLIEVTWGARKFSDRSRFSYRQTLVEVRRALEEQVRD